MYKIKSFIIDLCRGIVDKLELGIDDRKWEIRRIEAMEGFTEDQLKWVTQIIDNQITFCRNQDFTGSGSYEGRAARDKRTHVMLRGATAMCRELLPVSDIVGIQPLKGPVDNIWLMRYGYVTEKDENGKEIEQEYKKMRLAIEKAVVEAGSRKLQARWNLELSQDLSCVHGLDLETEVACAIGHEVAYEIIREILADLIALGSKATTEFDMNALYGTRDGEPVQLADTLQHLQIHINRMCSLIAASSRRGAGNFIVVSPIVLSLLQSNKTSVFAAGPASESTILQFVGTLHGTIRVYCLKYGLGDEELILAGYKGASPTDTGYIYSPYVPLINSGMVMDPVTFSPVMTLFTRYGKTIFEKKDDYLSESSQYYAVLKLTGPTLDISVDQVAQTVEDAQVV